MNPCMTEEILVAAATGDATAAERAHVRECPRCAARAVALDDDLRLLHRALVEEPLPGAMRVPRRRWMPVAGALAAAAMLALVWAAPWNATRPRPAYVAQMSSLARDVSFALFDPSQQVAVSQLSDSAYLQAALGGGWPCGGPGLHGVDCGAAETLALYSE